MAKEIENTMVENNVYILTDINQQTTNGLITPLTQWVNALPTIGKLEKEPKTTKNKQITDDSMYVIGSDTSYKIYTPYEATPQNIPVLNVYINSYGGKTSVMQAILSMFNIAKAKGAIIKTYNIGTAESCASMIAISGTHGYRYMAHNAINYIHFGSNGRTIQHTDEIDIFKEDLEKFAKTTTDIYLANSILTKKELKKYYNTEGSGTLDAIQCLTKKICDWVITPNGWTNKIENLQEKTR